MSIRAASALCLLGQRFWGLPFFQSDFMDAPKDQDAIWDDGDPFGAVFWKLIHVPYANRLRLQPIHFTCLRTPGARAVFVQDRLV